MKFPFIYLSALVIIVALVMQVTAVPGAAISSDKNISVSASPAQPVIRTSETLPNIRITPVPTPRPVSGEVEFPITRATPPPAFLRTNESGTPAHPPTTIRITPTIHVPVVTVTVLVYPSGPVYQPVYYYPPGYPYPINSYNPTGSLTVTSDPSEAIVLLDGYNSETTPWVFTGLTTGYHTVEIDYPGYEAYVTNVYVDNGGSAEVNAELTSLDTSGSLFVDSTPEGADVYVDGNNQGTSPVTVSGISAGAHQVELHLAGYEVLTSTENVAAGQGTVVNLVLVPYSSSSDSGSVDITSSVAGALVYLDGIYKGSTQSGTVFNIIAVSPGSHTILLHLPGYTDVTQTVQVTAGQISDVNAVFSQSPAETPIPVTPAPSSGSIIVTSAPAGGQVYVDNQFRGVAPVTIYNVAAGTHIINMNLPGYSDWSTSADIQAGQVVQITATLVPGSGAVPVPTRAGLSPVVVPGALALGAVIISGRLRR